MSGNAKYSSTKHLSVIGPVNIHGLLSMTGVKMSIGVYSCTI